MPIPLSPRPWLATIALISLAGCSKPAPPGSAQKEFDALVAACTQFLAAREAVVRPGPNGDWSKTGYSAAQVQSEVTHTESAVTPYVAKIVIKDNHAQVTASTEAAAAAIILTPAHLLSNRTHTFIYRFDGPSQRWHWENGQKLTKIPGQNDATVTLALADVAGSGPDGFRSCLPR